jgi:hypothetical protein
MKTGIKQKEAKEFDAYLPLMIEEARGSTPGPRESTREHVHEDGKGTVAAVGVTP